MPPEFFLGY